MPPRRAWSSPPAGRDGRSSRACTILAQRREWLTKARVDHQLVGGWTDVYGYDLPGEEGADWARFYNEHMAKDAAALNQLTALATVPLQDGEARGEGARRGARFRVQGRDDRDPAERRRRQSRRPRSLDPFWEVASARNAAIFLHPHYICSDDRLDGYDLINAVGRLADTTIAVGAAAILGSPDPVSGDEPAAVACRRRAALRARPTQAQQGDPSRLRRPGRRASAGSTSTPCCSSRWPCGSSATWSAPTR